MEFNILKGKNLSKFAALSASEYAGALFFDLTNNTIYFGSDKDADGNTSATVVPVAMNNGVTVAKTLNADNTRIETIYTIQGADGTTEAVSITDAQIPDIDEENFEGKDADYTYVKLGTGKAGLMNSVDKYILDEIANVLGITTEEYDKIDEGGTVHEVKFKMDLSNLASKITEQSNKFDGGTSDDSLKTLTSHGNLPADTSIAALENMTVSEILKAILFETATPTEIKSLAASISFKSPYSSTVPVGYPYPTVSDMNYSFTPETWQWTSKNDATVKGDEVAVNAFSSVTYYWSEDNTVNTSTDVDMSTTAYTAAGKKAVEGTNGYFFADIVYTNGSDAVDSLGNTTDTTGNAYKSAYSGNLPTSMKSFTGAWSVYSNCIASTTSSTTAAAWNTFSDALESTAVVAAGTVMSTEAGITNHGFNATKFYAAWPSKTSDNYSATDKYVMYVPASKSITSIGAFNALTGKWDVEIAIPTPTTISINNGYADGDFKVYEFVNNESLLNYYFVIG